MLRGGDKREDKKKVWIAIIILGLLLSCFTLVASADYVASSKSPEKVFHYSWCYYVDRIKPVNLISFDTCEDAFAAGYRPCTYCKPCQTPPPPPPNPPEVITNAATGIDTTYATLNGDLISTGGLSSQVWFEYGKTTSYGYSTPEQSKSLADSFSASISGLDDDTTYHFRAVASSGVGTDYGSDMTFTTETAISHIFDTGPGTYPSIFGTHKGTITPNQTLTVSKLYTYPCSGTGGHTESIEFYESDNLIANGTWNGYHGDYPNITIHNVTGAHYLTLIEDHEYNYTIHTGSYPQICHTDALQTANGWINCTEFVDVNGKRYKDRIPAIRLTHDEETLRIGAFNIQVFGKSKASKPEVMDVLGKIIRTYDVIAIQEIRDKSQTALPVLVNTVNSDNSEYDYVVSERLGRTTSKEQYAYIYNTQTVELTGTPYTCPEPEGTDPFHREPYIASFKALNGNFDVTLITIHVDKDEATDEIDALDVVVRYAQSVYPDEQDFFVMGDLNADCSYFDEDSNSTRSRSDYYWCINNSVDTTTKSTDCTYDRIIITNPAVSDFSGDSGVFRYDIEYGLTADETTAVSDHYPVYAEFWSNRDNDSDPTPTPEQTPTSIETAPTVYISDLNLVDEWVKITNSGTSQVTITVWKITDEMIAILQNSMMLTGI